MKVLAGLARWCRRHKVTSVFELVAGVQMDQARRAERNPASRDPDATRPRCQRPRPQINMSESSMSTEIRSPDASASASTQDPAPCGGTEVGDVGHDGRQNTGAGADREEGTARDHLALALDLDDLVAALRTAATARGVFLGCEVGLELFSAAGPETWWRCRGGFRVFVDLKLHDIPTTVGRAARVLGALGVSLPTVHTSGGLTMVEAATSGMADGASSAGLPLPCVLGVTILTSDANATPDELTRRAQIAAQGGCGGVVCAASDLSVVSAAAPGLRKVVPGIRPSDASVDDQARVATPGAAVRAGADLLVIGRAVTAASDPVAAARSVLDEVAGALSRA